MNMAAALKAKGYHYRYIYAAAALVVSGGALTTNAPTFFDSGHSMYFVYSPWAADYVRLPRPRENPTASCDRRP
jgi:hypothetical protein